MLYYKYYVEKGIDVMKNKKILFILTAISSINLLAMEGKISTNSDFTFNFSPLLEDEEKDIEYKSVDFKNLTYNTKILDLELNFNEIGLQLGSTLKSKREDIRLNDYDFNTFKDGTVKKNSGNHDIMPKLYLGYNKNFNDLTFKTDIKYYVDNFWNNHRKINKETNEVTELSIPYYYLEEDNSKEELGNTIIKASLDGKIKNTEIGLNLDYKANNLVNFNIKESYFKLNSLINSKLNDFLISAKYDLNLDLDISAKPFDTFDTDLKEYPDFMDGNYIERLIQNMSAKIEYDSSTIKDFSVIGEISSDIDMIFVKGEHPKSRINFIWTKANPKLEVKLNKKVHNNVTISPAFVNLFSIKSSNYINKEGSKKTVEEIVKLAYKPELNFSVKYDNKITDDEKYFNEFTIGYNPVMTLTPELTPINEVEHNIKLADNFLVEYKFFDKLKLKSQLDTEVKIPVVNKLNGNIDSKLKLDTSLNYQINDKMKYDISLVNDLKSKSEAKLLNPDTLQNKIELKNEFDYKILENEKENLNYNAEFSLSNSTSFDFYIENEDKELNEENTVLLKDAVKNRSRIYSGRYEFTASINRFNYNNNIEYKRKINNKLDIVSNLSLNTAINMLAVKSQKVYNFTREIENDKEKPVLSNYREVNWNLGGKIEIIPNIKFNIKPIEKLDLEIGLGSKILFERKVLNVIENEYRKDDGKFGEIDKYFGFKKLEPKISIMLMYKW